MNVRFAGRHVGIDASDRAYAETRIDALARFHRRIMDLEVRVMLDGKGRETVELAADLGRRRAVSRSDAPGFREAFDDAVEALRRQLLKDKEKVVGRRRRATRRTAAPRPGGEGPPR